MVLISDAINMSYHKDMAQPYKKENNIHSQLRLDIVSEDWVVIAVNRAQRPEMFAQKERIKEGSRDPGKDCPFCGEEIFKRAVFKRGNVFSIPNDFPIFSEGDDLNIHSDGPYETMDGVGFHEVIITKDHNRPMALFTSEEVKEAVDVYQSRYIELAKNKFVTYISIFHNHGKEAGASVYHPHSQMVAIPVIDPDLKNSIEGAEKYYKKTGLCVYCTMIGWDKKDEERIIYENKKFIVLSPFAPQSNFEVRIYPKEHSPCFEKMDETEKQYFADALKTVLYKIYKGLNDPAYNFYIHTAPAGQSPLGGAEDYKNYHWHLVIMPKPPTPPAGFEFCAGMEINTIEPEKAAEFLRNVK